MFKRTAFITTALALTIALAVTIAASTDSLTKPSSVIVHEWGTFTTVAGPNGDAIDWLPLSGPVDLPCFVLHFERDNKQVIYKSMSAAAVPLSYEDARKQLIGRVRMETPVLYFYTSTAQDLRVKVDFPHGIISEWYPGAAVEPTVIRKNTLTPANNPNASITWENVHLLPGAKEDFASGSEASHYYAARATDASPIRVNGFDEKFLFYRGIGDFPAPLNVTVTDNGQIRLRHLAGKPGVILFESRGGKMGYRLVDTTKNEAVLEPLALTGDFASLRKDLESVLVSQGLYAKEAAAMVETWRDSWFTEGTRVFYIVPPAMIDQILPLSISPKPESTARVFVGRIEVFTPATIDAVEKAVEAIDWQTLRLYGRYLGPISERILAKPGKPGRGPITGVLASALREYLDNLSKCAN